MSIGRLDEVRDLMRRELVQCTRRIRGREVAQSAGRVCRCPRERDADGAAVARVTERRSSGSMRLFDAVPDKALRLDGDYVDIATDWAFMLPVVEMAAHPVHITEPLYLYEPSGMPIQTSIL